MSFVGKGAAWIRIFRILGLTGWIEIYRIGRTTSLEIL
jgi:hypothetical protein